MGNSMHGVGLVVALVGVLAGCEIRPLDPATGRALVEDEAKAFDAATFVEENWDTRILPLMRDESTDLSLLLDQLSTDPEAATPFGHRVGEGPLHVRVRGEGRVVRVDTTSRAGTLTVALATGREATIQIGPVIRGTALRDALPFASFDQFVNQLEFAGVSNALHARVGNAVLASLDRAMLEGALVRFVGVTVLRDTGELVITPVLLELISQ